MPHCPNCGGDYDASDLIRHEHHHLVVVHCPDCHMTMGRYRDR